jgi:hypothetical protein
MRPEAQEVLEEIVLPEHPFGQAAAEFRTLGLAPLMETALG